MSLFINSSGVKPVRPSQSGSHPASGAIRSGAEVVSGFSIVDASLVESGESGAGAKALVVARVESRAAAVIFMVVCSSMNGLA